MKVKYKSNDEGFKPFDFTIKFESAEELESFFALFNHNRINEALDITYSIQILEGLIEANGKRPNYCNAFEKLKKLMKERGE